MAKQQVDLVNDTVRIAREVAFAQVQYALRLLPNPIGQVKDGDIPSRISLDEIRRLGKGA